MNSQWELGFRQFTVAPHGVGEHGIELSATVAGDMALSPLLDAHRRICLDRAGQIDEPELHALDLPLRDEVDRERFSTVSRVLTRLEGFLSVRTSYLASC